MAKSASQIATEMATSITTSDPTLDASQGPLVDTMVRPQSGQLADVALAAENLRLLFTLNFSQVATTDEIRQALANYGSTPGGGTAATHVQTFMRFTKPTFDIPIPTGTLVSNIDGSLIYQVVTAGTITVAGGNTFYNPNTRAYEIGLLVQATGVGAAYELPPQRVNTILTPIQGIDSTTNRVTGGSTLSGLDAEAATDQSSRLLTALRGRNQGGPGGLKALILNAVPESVTDVSIVQPVEKEFKRVTAGPALDIYLLGNAVGTTTEVFRAVAGQTVFALSKVPAFSIQAVTVNGVSNAVTFSLVSDQSPESGLSLRANDVVVLGTSLLADDLVSITYTFNKTLSDVLTKVFGSGDSLLFNTDILLRQPFPIPPKIAGQIRLLPSYSVAEVESALTDYLKTALTFTQFQSTIVPETFRQDLITAVNGIQSFRITTFQRSSGSLADVEVIAFSKSETSTYDTTKISIQVIS